MKTRTVRRLAAAAIAAVATTGTVAATAGGAQAAALPNYSVSQGLTPYWIADSNTGMPVSVADASSDNYHRVIQWYNTGGDEQKWYFDGVTDTTTNSYVGFMLRNKNSGKCLGTDGTAGDTLFQLPCDPYIYGIIWNNAADNNINGIRVYWRYTNRDTGLKLDVNGDSYSAGASVDLWYANGAGNQAFFLTATS